MEVENRRTNSNGVVRRGTGFSLVGDGAMTDGVNAEGFAGQREDQAIVADTETPLAGEIAVELSDVALAAGGEAEQDFKDAHGGRLVQTPDIGAGFFGPINLVRHVCRDRCRDRRGLSQNPRGRLQRECLCFR